jgi:hypothetical protein
MHLLRRCNNTMGRLGGIAAPTVHGWYPLPARGAYSLTFVACLPRRSRK